MLKQLLGLFIVTTLLNVSLADYKKDIGYTRVVNELGTKIPKGKGVIVTQSESSGKTTAYMPDIKLSEFKNKTITDKSSPLPLGPYSAHATGVGKAFFGNNAIANGITEINCYSANGWLITDYLNADHRSLEPKAVNDRIANHSWIGGIKDEKTILNVLKRIDWVINRDEFIQVVGIKNSAELNSPMLSAAFNVIAVGKTSGDNGRSTKLLDPTYISGRSRPHIVVPANTSSGAAPIVASTIAFLIETAHNNPNLSTDPKENFTTNRNGEKIYNAERSEVIKAILMAGADKFTNNSTKLKNDTQNNIIDYRVDQKYHTDNGLDVRYGAGQLNIFNSYKIISAGEQNSKEDDPASDGVIVDYGFDYDPSFGGKHTTASYYFTTDTKPGTLIASLVWNVNIRKGTIISFPGKAINHNLDLGLYKIKNNNKILISKSNSLIDNSENILVSLEPSSRYLLEVTASTEQELFEWDYAIAWQISH